MIIGNDIVDLKTISAKWQCPRVLEKLFTLEEQSLILSSKDPHQSFWHIWSMKEAAYKAHLQQFQVRFFNPRRLKCQIFNETNGIVSIDDKHYYTNSSTTEDYVHTYAKIDKSFSKSIEVYQSDETNHWQQSFCIRKMLISSLSRTLGITKCRLSVQKNINGIPTIYNREVPLNISFSLSHCGRFLAFTY